MAPVSAVLRVLIAINAAISLLVGLLLFVFPGLMSSLWPWPLTPLTSCAIGSGLFAMTAGLIQFIRENDWRRTRTGTVSYILVGALQPLALARYARTVGWSRPGVWLYVLFMTAILVGGLYSTFAVWQPFTSRAQPEN
jgi:hypothetical protein